MRAASRAPFSQLGRRAVGAILIASIALACGTTSNGSSPGACIPGASASCSGVGGCRGGQVCNAEGSAYGTCDCGGQAKPDAGAHADGAGSSKDGGPEDAHAGDAVPADARIGDGHQDSTVDAAPLDAPIGDGREDSTVDAVPDVDLANKDAGSKDVTVSDGTAADATKDSSSGNDALLDGSATVAPTDEDADSSVTCTFTTTNPGLGHTGCLTCNFPPEETVTETHVPMYFTNSCEIMSANETTGNVGLVLDAPQATASFTEETSPFCVGVATAYPGDLVAEPIGEGGGYTWSGTIVVNGTQGTVAVTATEPGFGCAPQCIAQTLTCSGVGTVWTDKCLTNNGGCDANATCTWAGPNAVSCACKMGYSGDGTTCVPLPNPCLTNNGGCSVNATCTDNLGNPECKCNAGYTGDGVSCVAP